MSASSSIAEIKSLSDEIKRRNHELKKLRSRKKLLETQLIDFLDNHFHQLESHYQRPYR